MHKKILICIGFTFLILGVGIQPAIATVEPEIIDTDYYDVNVEFCGLGKNHTVQLTQQQFDELGILFESINVQIDNAETIRETIKIYNEAIEELDNLGMLMGYSVKQVQELVSGEYQKPGFTKLIDRKIDKNQFLSDINIFCLIAGMTTITYVLPNTMIVNRLIIFYNILNILFNNNFKLGPFLNLYIFLRTTFNIVFNLLLPLTFNLGSGICLGTHYSMTYDAKPAEGWVNTNGLFGQKKWDGSFYGRICKIPLFIDHGYLGVICFKGIRIMTRRSAYTYYLGFANYVNIR